MSAWKERAVDIAAKFRRNGFAVAEGLADQNALDTLRPIYDGFLDGTIACPTTNRKLGGLTRQIIMPHAYCSDLQSNPVVAAAREIAREIQECDEPEFVFSMLIYKPGGHTHITPWHQDMSYVAAPTLAAGARLPNNCVTTFWVALDDVDESMGCMEFIPNAQTNPMPEHFVYSGDPMSDDRLTAIRDPETTLDLSSAIKCPLRAGSATIHGYATPHFTGPNKTSRGRRAFIFSFNHPETTKLVAGVLTEQSGRLPAAG